MLNTAKIMTAMTQNTHKIKASKTLYYIVNEIQMLISYCVCALQVSYLLFSLYLWRAS